MGTYLVKGILPSREDRVRGGVTEWRVVTTLPLYLKTPSVSFVPCPTLQRLNSYVNETTPFLTSLVLSFYQGTPRVFQRTRTTRRSTLLSTRGVQVRVEVPSSRNPRSYKRYRSYGTNPTGPLRRRLTPLVSGVHPSPL